MGLKKRSKLSAEFNMSSLTDVIFLLLIFFMLNANCVNVAPFHLPASDSKTVAPVSIVVAIRNTGVLEVDNKEVKIEALERILRTEASQLKKKEDATVTIVAEVGTPFDDVVKIMNAAAKLKMKAILATEPRT